MLFILALAVGIIGGALANNYVPRENTLVRIAATVAGFILGFWVVHLIAANV